MKVLLVLEATLGGTSRHVLDLATGLLDRGIEVHLAYSTLRADDGFRSGLAALRAAWPGFQCREMRIARRVTISDVSCYLELQRFIDDHGPFEVIHAHSTKAGFLSRLLLRRGGARMVYTPHGLMTMNPALKGWRRHAVCALESILAGRSDAVISVSSDEHRCALDTGIGAPKLIRIPNGIHQSDAEFQLRQREAIRTAMALSGGVVCIGFVGRFFSYKEPGRLIEAFYLLKRRTARSVRLAMIGWGELEPELRRQVNAQGLSEDVVFLGQVDGASHIPAFDILAHTSRFEAFGYVFLEALSAGVPIVTTRVGGTEELVSDGVTGYICDPWDAERFAYYLQLLVDDPEHRLRMSGPARERAAPYGVANMVDSIAGLYDRLRDQPSPGPIPSVPSEGLS